MKRKKITLVTISTAMAGVATLSGSIILLQKWKKERERNNKKEKIVSWRRTLMWTLISGLLRALSNLLIHHTEKMASEV